MATELRIWEVMETYHINYFLRKIMAKNINGTVFNTGQDLNTYKVLRISQPRIATWYVRSLSQTRKPHNTIKEMRRMKIDILGMSENSDHRRFTAEETICVAILVSSNIRQYVEDFVPFSDRVIMIRLRSIQLKSTSYICTHCMQYVRKKTEKSFTIS